MATTPVPAGDGAPAGTATRATRTAAGRTYTVRSGDTLLAIALRYDTTVDALVKANNLTTADAILAIGQRLLLP